MGKLNNIKIEIKKTLDAIELVKIRTGPKTTTQNKIEYDRLYRRLRHYQSQLESLGTENLIHRVILMNDQLVYFTGLTLDEVKELLRDGLKWEWKGITEIIPGKIIYWKS